MNEAVFNAGFDNFIGIIIFLVVIVRVISAIKNAASPQKNNTGPAPEKSPEQDLERFFKTLTGEIDTEESRAPEAPAPPPLPLHEKRVKPVSSSVNALLKQKKDQASLAKSAKQTKNKYLPQWGKAAFSLGGAAPTSINTAVVKAVRSDVMTMLQNSTSLKKAILLREILGPPAAMRR